MSDTRLTENELVLTKLLDEMVDANDVVFEDRSVSDDENYEGEQRHDGGIGENELLLTDQHNAGMKSEESGNDATIVHH